MRSCVFCTIRAQRHERIVINKMVNSMKHVYVEFIGNGEDDFGNRQPGVIHLQGSACQSDYTLCGITLDNDEKTAGHNRAVHKQAITCGNCAQIIDYCKGVKVKRL